MIVNNTHILTLPLYTTTTATCHTHFHFTNAFTSLCTALASAVLYPVPFTHNAHDYPHFNIYISFGGPKYRITALNTYITPLLHHILTTQFIHTYVNITKKSPPKSPKHKK
ncbi:BAG_1a_G0028610.mRNA.1.CDS.1 [Saccharomyces cerevisiae]|nr:BAG_1a_G0028610.mRNA.1.CDS.1 [Saccharomyces cerevisiae]CAI7100563.1 BAG_1a_G0028610.mRNA.1.CDS.1 [Saccharomyces cerevisiae]